MARTQTRDLTDGERQALSINTAFMVTVVCVGAVAMTVSWFALRWVGLQSGLHPVAAAAIPLAIDGAAITCGLFVVSPSNTGKDLTSAWAVLLIVVGVSVGCNAIHSVHYATGLVPDWFVMTFASCPPIVVALCVHGLGRSMANSPKHTMVAGRVRLNLEPAHSRADTVRAPEPPARATDAPAVRAPENGGRAPARDNGTRERVREEVRRQAAADPDTKPVAAKIHTLLGLTHHKATTRTWVTQDYQEWKNEQPQPDLIDQ